MAQAAPHVSKAQKRRQAREQEDADREQRIADELAQMGDSERALEGALPGAAAAAAGAGCAGYPGERRPLLLQSPGCSCLACKAERMAQKHFTGSDTEAARLLKGAWLRRLMGTASTGQ